MKYEKPEELAPWCALNRIFGFSPKTGALLTEHFSGAAGVFRACREELSALLGKSSVHLSQINDKVLDEALREMEDLLGRGYRFICIDDDRYPALLKDCEDPPIGLYLKSDSSPEEVFGYGPAVAIVGTRDISSYGKEICIRLVKALARAGVKPMIVSGLAIGTDITAQTAALEGGLPTLSVMATGIEEVYPFRHGWAAERICKAPHSGLITDYPPGTVPKAINFLRRNRIIAGISRMTILIESKSKGGGLMTCRLANSYNREVYAVPGRLDDPCSAGCNSLIKSHMAEIVNDIDEFVESLGFGSAGKGKASDIKSLVYQKYLESEGGEEAERMSVIADIVRQNRDILPEELCSFTDIPYSKMAEYIGKMVCDGIIVTDLLQRCSVNPEIL